MIKFGVAVFVGCEDAVVQQPEPFQFGIDIHTGDDTDAFDNPVGIATVLTANELDREREILVEHGIVKDNHSLVAEDDLLTGLLPDQMWREFVVVQQPVELIVTELLAVIGEICQRVVDLTADQELAVI